MKKTRNAKVHNIFLLDKEKVKKNIKKDHNITEYELIDEIVKKTGYKEQKIGNQIDYGGFHVKFFFRLDENKESRLVSFCKSFIEPGQEVLNYAVSTASSVMFIWREKYIFVITTGQGFRLIENYFVPNFGMLVVGKFNEKFRVKALDANIISSKRHSNKTIYANEENFIDIEELDVIYREIIGRINDPEKIKELLNLDGKLKKYSLTVKAKNFIQIGRSLDLNHLLQVLEKLDSYDYSSLCDIFNSIEPINSKYESDVVEKNNDEVMRKIYDAISGNLPFEFDLFNSDANNFIAADRYEIKDVRKNRVLFSADSIDALEFVKEAYKKYLGNSKDDYDEFKKFADSVRIVAMKEDIVVTSNNLLGHISGEIEVDGKNYYIFYGNYYFLSESYKDRLDKVLGRKLVGSIYVDEFKTKWNDNDNEDSFNRNVSVNERYFHLHKITPENVEFADLLKIEDESVTIVHVKDGFDNNMRALDRQVEMSITRLLDLRSNNNKEYMCKLYKKACESGIGENIKVSYDEDSFLDAMKNKKVRYIIAIRPKNKTLLKNSSNIAKHCLNKLILRCFDKSIDLKINIL